MTRKLRANRAIAQLQNLAKMINRPTVVPTSGPENPGLVVARTDPYFSFEVDTTGQTAPVEIILFDGSQGYQFGYNASLPLGVNIVGRTMPYEYIVNDMVHNSSFIDIWRLQVTSTDPNIQSADVAMTQFSNAVNIFDASKGGKPRLVDNFYPDMGIHEGQYHLTITTFEFKALVTNRTALVYMQEPNTKMIWSCYQKAELGRHQ